MMINLKKVFGVISVGFLFVTSSFAINLFDSAKSLGGLDKLKEKLSKEISNGKESLGKYANDTLSSSLGGIDLSGILTGGQEGFQSDLNNGVSNVVQSSLDYSKGLKSSDLSSVIQSLTPFIEKTLSSSISNFNMGEAASSLFKSEFFQENITGFLSNFISGNLKKGVEPVVNSNLIQSLSQDFFKSPGFLESIASLAAGQLTKSVDKPQVEVEEPKTAISVSNIPIEKVTQSPKEVQVTPISQSNTTKTDNTKKTESVGWMSYVKSLLGF